MTTAPNHHDMHQKQKDQRRQWNQIICQALLGLGIRPQTVGDWGCGYGFFLNRAFEILKIREGRGFDGDYIDLTHFDGDSKNFYPTDLNQNFPVYPCDLAVCLEVAEHLAPEKADVIVENLCQSSNVVLFSAALPYQDGLGHINCQYPSYWAQKFLAHNFVPIDAMRQHFWSRPQQAIWFRQNMLLFIEIKTLMRHYQHLLPFITRMDYLDFVHPRLWEGSNKKIQSLTS